MDLNSNPIFSKKTAWRGRELRHWDFYCPNCKQGRRIPMPRNPMNATSLFQVTLATAMFVLVAWRVLGIKGVVVFIPFWALYEGLYRLRTRSVMACPHCGFDPFLYAQDARLARKEIEAYWRRKFKEKGVAFPGDPVPESTKPATSDSPSASP